MSEAAQSNIATVDTLASQPIKERKNSLQHGNLTPLRSIPANLTPRP